MRLSSRLRAVFAALLVAGAACADPVPVAERPAAIEAMYAGYAKDFVGVPEVTAEGARALEAEAVFVDVREPAEMAVSRIPNAITPAELEARKAEIGDKQVVVYCTIGARSGLAALDLRKDGFNAYNLRGSLLAWTFAGGPLVDPAGVPTKKVHVYGSQWNLVAEGYEAVW